MVDMNKIEQTTDPSDGPKRPLGQTESQPRRGIVGRVFALLSVAMAFTLVSLLIVELAGGSQQFRSMIEHSGVWAPAVYVLLKTATYILAPLSGTTLKLASGALFGVWEGMALTLIGDVLGGSLNYWIARTLGRKGVQRFAGKKALVDVELATSHVGGWRALLVARVVLSAIYDFISYAAGLARLPYMQFLAVTTLGGVAPALFFAAIGDATVISETLTYMVIAATAVVLVVIGVVYAVYRRRRADRVVGSGIKDKPQSDPLVTIRRVTDTKNACWRKISLHLENQKITRDSHE